MRHGRGGGTCDHDGESGTAGNESAHMPMMITDPREASLSRHEVTLMADAVVQRPRM